MSRFFWGFLAGAAVFGAFPLIAEEVLRISPGGSAPLADRVEALEKAVQQMQNQVYGPPATAPAKGAATPAPNYGVTCALETPFDGAFSANAPKEEDAREETLKRCRDKAKNSIYCSRKEVKCSR